tara:strand:- start:156 stop:545 length:390 start_codon:yes stop_codon:yes gene_type:complete
MGHNPDMGAYEHAKVAAIVGLGYLAVKRPRAAGAAVIRIGAHYAMQLVTDVRAVSKIIGEELIAPEAAQIKARPKPLTGAIVVISPWLPVFLFGSHLATAIDDVFGTVSGDTIFGSQDHAAAYCVMFEV